MKLTALDVLKAAEKAAKNIKGKPFVCANSATKVFAEKHPEASEADRDLFRVVYLHALPFVVTVDKKGVVV